MNKNTNKTTHFGFQDVPVDDKVHKVAEVFDRVAEKYDLMNDLMSLGTHRLWKKFAIDCASFKRGQAVLDLAGGTGDLTAKISPIIGTTGSVTLADINPHMLMAGRDRLLDQGLYQNIQFIQTNAESLCFPKNHFDRIIIGFGLRNVTDQLQALKEMYRVLKPGGIALVLEFSKPTSKPLSKLYDLYSFSVLPKLGEFVAKDEASYRYLAESIRKHPDQQSLKILMQDAGFEDVDYYNLAGGITAVHRGRKY